MHSLKALFARAATLEVKLKIGFKLECLRPMCSAVGRGWLSWLASLINSKDPGMKSS